MATATNAPDREEHMLGHGFYNKHSHAQGAANSYGVPLIARAVAALDAGVLGGALRLADYGSAQGHNSLLPMRGAIAALRARQPSPAPAILVIHTDLPGNDWTTLFETVLSSPESYLAGTTDVFTFASGTSIYRRIFPPSEIALGYSAITTHWLSRKPGELPDHIWSARATGAPRTAWAAQARADWYAFLGHRAAELVPSGRLVMVNSGADARGDSGAEGLADLANQTLQALVREGALFADEYAGMAIPTYYRVEREWREPFEDASFTRAHPLVLEHYEEARLADVYLEDYERTHDAETFARAYAGFFRAAYEPVLFAGLRASRSVESGQAVKDLFAQRMQAALAKAPSRYSARWVLQLMLVGKRA
jgi:S-adenosylmethionine-dependent carboxyl methyltransferase